MNNLKLQKLLYFCEGVYAAIHKGERLIEDTDFLAWGYGPVIPEIYYRFNGYGQKDLPMIENIDFRELTEIEIVVITNVWNKLKFQHAFDLVQATLEENSPWFNVFHHDAPGGIINHAKIYNYFNGEHHDRIEKMEKNSQN